MHINIKFNADFFGASSRSKKKECIKPLDLFNGMVARPNYKDASKK